MSDPTAAEQFRRFERRLVRQLEVRVAFRRVANSIPAIVQIVAAVATAYSIAHYGIGHATPILAVTVTINSLGLSRDARPGRVAQSVLGIVLGVAVSDGLSLLFGRGLWQLVLVLVVVFVVARLIAKTPSFAVAAAVPSALVVLLPAAVGGPFGRTLDAAVGGVVALLFTALIPRNPTGEAKRDRRALFSVTQESLQSIVECLAGADEGAGELALNRLRRTQPIIDQWTASLDTALSVSRLSPFLRRHVPDLNRNARVLAGMDLAVRNLRTIARRAEFLVRDGVERPALAGLIGEFGASIQIISDELDNLDLTGATRSLLSDLARRLDPERIVPGAPVADSAFVLMLRPLAVDLLTTTGMTAEEARALLPPV